MSTQIYPLGDEKIGSKIMTLSSLRLSTVREWELVG